MCFSEFKIRYEYFLQSARHLDKTKRLVIETKLKKCGKIEANFVCYHNDLRVLTCKSETYAREFYEKINLSAT